ncbi:MAG: hypothetical protein WC319_09495 [Candidatus Paceibacterota bacterium]|jgi:flagellar biosynthesis chaperone FliJ
MNLETLKIANELKTAIEDRKRYGEKLEVQRKEYFEYFERGQKNVLKINSEIVNTSDITLKDIDAIDVLETAIARNDREIKKLEKQFENLK